MPGIPEEKLTKIREIEFSINKQLFRICAAITLMAMAMVITEFFTRGTFLPSRIGFLYIGILFIYSVHKEMLRWLEEKKVERQGEWFLYSWIALALILYLVNFLTKDYFSCSTEGARTESLKEVTEITLEVGAIFLIARLSKVVKLILEKK